MQALHIFWALFLPLHPFTSLFLSHSYTLPWILDATWIYTRISMNFVYWNRKMNETELLFSCKLRGDMCVCVVYACSIDAARNSENWPNVCICVVCVEVNDCASNNILSAHTNTLMQEQNQEQAATTEREKKETTVQQTAWCFSDSFNHHLYFIKL